MPRVTPEHTAARRQQILDAAHACFLQDGFHQTSMADIQRESGLSAGAIYLYFKGKDEIVLGLARQILETVATLFPAEPVVDGNPVTLPDLVNRFLVQAERVDRERSFFPIAIQIWAEAIRNPRMREELMESLDVVRLRVERLVAASQERGIVRADASPAAIAMALIGIGQGYIVQRMLLGEGSLDVYSAGVRAILDNPAGA